MKIQNVNRSEVGTQSLHEIESRGNSPAKPLVFKKTLSEHTKEQRDAHLNARIRDIDEQSARLLKKADITEFERYRKLIRDFIDAVVSDGYEFSKESAYGTRGRHRFFATVKTIDEKLDAIAKDVLSDQKDNIAILNKIDDIRGLILDMMI